MLRPSVSTGCVPRPSEKNSMPASPTSKINIFEHNRTAWDRQAASRCEWSQPVGADVIAAARRGNWSVRLTPNALPADWLPDVRAQRILCLASAGGQQAPVLAAAGADVTVFDASAAQLAQDEMVAHRDGLALKIVQGDMRDLSVFADGRRLCILFGQAFAGAACLANGGAPSGPTAHGRRGGRSGA